VNPDILSHGLILVTLLIISAFVSAAETSLFSITRVDLEKLKKDRHPKYKTIKEILKEPRDTLISIIICNDLANILITIVSTTIFYTLFHDQKWWVISIISIAITTPVVLVLGEITPKTLAARFHIGFAAVLCDAIFVLTKILSPLRWLIAQFTFFIVKSFSFKTNGKRSLMEEEFKMLVDASKQEGILGEDEQDLIHNVFKLSDRAASDIMTKKEDIFSLSLNEPFERILRAVKENYHSRIPVYEKDTESITGILLTKDLLSLTRNENDSAVINEELKKMSRIPYVVPMNKKIDVLFRELKTKKLHMAIVINENNTLAGLVTMDDILKELFGEAHD